VRNALPTIKRVAQDLDPNAMVRASSPSIRSHAPDAVNTPRRLSIDQDTLPVPGFARHMDRSTREDFSDLEPTANTSGPLVDTPFIGSEKGWEAQIETVLKSFYSSISRERLPLFGAPAEVSGPTASGSLLAMTGNMLRRTPSTLSKAQSETPRGRTIGESRTLGNRLTSKGRSRARLTATQGFGSSRTSLDDLSSGWSPSMSSTWSKVSLGKTLTSVSVDSFGSEAIKPDYQSSIGFANALSQAIIREDQLDLAVDEGMKATPLLEDESLELCGAPWAKEGIVKHKFHLGGMEKRSNDRNWSDCFAVIERGWMRLFSFSMNAKSLRQRAKNQMAGGVVGGGNWQDNAEEMWKFLLRHTIASSLPPPGYSKARPYVWALSLPTGAVHLFSVGTPDIVKEFVSTANYWSARLSKEPMMGGISNMEYGWSDSVINRSLTPLESQPVPHRACDGRPSTQLSMRSSIDHGTGTVRPKLPGDKIFINEWVPPQQSMMASRLMEIDQLKGLQAYVKTVEEDFQKHNELRAPMLMAFSARHPNSSKAMSNWEKKSSYLLREIVKFRTYIDNLETAQASKERIYALRKEDEKKKQPNEALGVAIDAVA
jgi:Pleckstrin homology domain